MPGIKHILVMAAVVVVTIFAVRASGFADKVGLDPKVGA